MYIVQKIHVAHFMKTIDLHFVDVCVNRHVEFEIRIRGELS